MIRPIAPIAVLLSVAACASAPQSGPATSTSPAASSTASSTTAAPRARPRGSSREVIVAAEITASSLEPFTAFEVVERLRPHMLRGRVTAPYGAKRIRQLAVFVNGSDTGGGEVLRTISARNIARIQYMGSVEATNKLDLADIVGGAILITLK